MHTAAGYANLAEETGDTGAFEHVHSAHDQMATMIEQLLALSRREFGAEPLEVIDFPARVRETWGTLQLSGVELVLDVPPDTKVRSDRTALHHVLSNLFENTAAHNEPPLTVAVGLIADDGVPEGFYVEDDGTGIAVETTNTVFEHGYTTDSTGNGLGLSIVREYAEDLGWTVRVTESESGGARFEFRDVEFDLG